MTGTPMTRSACVTMLGLALLTGACGAAETVPSGSAPSHVASTSPTPTMVAALPPELVHPWFRWTESTTKWDRASTWILGMETPTTVRLGPTGVEAAIRPLEGDTVEIVSATASDGCLAGDAGRYDWSLSSSGRKLHVAPEADNCDARMADLRGDWIVSDCPAYPESFCLGPLDPGVHVTNYFTPLVPGSAWELDPAAMSYRVPEGWSNTYDSPNEYTLEPPTGPRRGVYMWTDVTIVSDSWPCTPSPWSNGRAKPAEMAEWLARQAALDTTMPVAVDLGGLQGLRLDVAVRSGASLPCRGDGLPFAPFLAHVDGSGLQWGFSPGNRSRVYLLDLTDGRTLVIDIVGLGESAEEHLDAGTGIVESIRFRT